MEINVASGPVIIENNKVLLDRERKDYGLTPWFFPGGRLNSPDEDLEAACRREAREELGIEIEIIKKLATIETVSLRDQNKKYTLHHYLAKRIGEIKMGDDVAEYGWFDIDNLPPDCAPNVYEIIKGLLSN